MSTGKKNKTQKTTSIIYHHYHVIIISLVIIVIIIVIIIVVIIIAVISIQDLLIVSHGCGFGLAVYPNIPVAHRVAEHYEDDNSGDCLSRSPRPRVATLSQ